MLVRPIGNKGDAFGGAGSEEVDEPEEDEKEDVADDILLTLDCVLWVAGASVNLLGVPRGAFH